MIKILCFETGEAEELAGFQPSAQLDEADLDALVAKVADGTVADIDRLGAAYAVGRMQTSNAVDALVNLLSHHAESARRAAGYGLTVGGPLAAKAMVELLLSPAAISIPTREPPVADNIDEHAAAIPPLAHALAQLATHAVSLKAVQALVAAQNRAKAEIQDYSTRVHYVRDDGLYDFYVRSPAFELLPSAHQWLCTSQVIQRRRAIAECNFALGHIGQVAAAQNEAPVCLACVSALLAIACDVNGEPGGLFKSYMTSVRVVHSAITNLIRLCSSPSSCAATPLVHGTPNNL